jgi:hypothetical protein
MTSLRGQASRAKNDVPIGQANSTGIPPKQKSKQSRVMNLSLYKRLGWGALIRK